MLYTEVVELVNKNNEKLMASDPRLENDVLVNHSDGMLFQKSAFIEVIENEYLVVYMEHGKPEVFELCCVSNYAQFQLQYPQINWDDEGSEDLTLPERV